MRDEKINRNRSTEQTNESHWIYLRQTAENLKREIKQNKQEKILRQNKMKKMKHKKSKNWWYKG